MALEEAIGLGIIGIVLFWIVAIVVVIMVFIAPIRIANALHRLADSHEHTRQAIIDVGNAFLRQNDQIHGNEGNDSPEWHDVPDTLPVRDASPTPTPAPQSHDPPKRQARGLDSTETLVLVLGSAGVIVFLLLIVMFRAFYL